MSNIATINLGEPQRYGQMSKLLYMTDGLHQPKMYDGTSLVNWGITAPKTTPVVAASSTGANLIDACDAVWSPVKTLLHDGESALMVVNGVTNVVATTSSIAKVGANSSLTLVGYAAEPITTNTVLMMHMDGTDGQTTGFVDSSANNFTITNNKPLLVKYVTAQKVFGASSLWLNGNTGDTEILTLPANACWEPSLFGNGFTIDMRFRHTYTAVYHQGQILLSRGYYNEGFWISYNSSNQIKVRIQTTEFVFTTPTIFDDTWTHLRLCVQYGLMFLFINGTRCGLPQVITAGLTIACAGTSDKLCIGCCQNNPYNFPGYIDELRWDNVCLSTTDFVIPTSPYGSWVAPSGTPTGVTGLIAYKALTPIDLSGYYGIQFWIRSLVPTNGSDIALTLCDSAAAIDTLEVIQIPALPAYTWTHITYMFLTPTALTSVASLGLSINRDLGQNGIYIDDIQAIRCLVSLETDPAKVTQGSACVRLDISGNCPDGTVVAYNNFSPIDMHSDTLVMASIRTTVNLGTGQLQYLLDDTADCASPLEAIAFPDLLDKDVNNNVQFTLVTPAALTAVISHGIKVVKQSVTPITIWIDNVRRAITTSGNLTGRYFVWASFYSSKYDRESDLSPISGVVDTVGQGISLSAIPVSADPQVDMRRIYRSAAGGTVPYLDSTIPDNTTSTLTLNKSEASILASIRHPSLGEGSGKFAPPPAASYLVQTKNRFVLAGSRHYTRGTLTATAGSATFTFTSAQLDDSFIGRTIQIIGDTVQYIIESVNAGAGTCVARPISDLIAGTYSGTSGAAKTYYIFSDSENTVFTSYIDDDDTYRPHGFPIEFAQDITEGAANDIISGLGLVGDAILVTKFSSSHLLEGAYPPFAVSKISAVVGCISHDTICQDENAGALWLAGEQGIAYCNGSSVSIISGKIRDIFTGDHALKLNATRFQYAHAVYDTKEKMYYLFCSSATSSVNDVCLVLDKSKAEPDWYYFTGIEAASSTIVYSSTGLAEIYIGDYDGFQYKLNTGWYDGVAAGSTLSGTATSAAASTLNDTGATFYTTGSGLRNIPLLVYKVSTGETWVYKITSNTAQQLTISGTFTEIPSTSDYQYYIGGYQIDWKSKQFELMRPTDKKLLMDGVLNNYKLALSQTIRIQLLKNLAGTQIANQLRDLSEGEEQVLLVRERVSQAQWQISGFVHGQNVQIVSLGLRLKGRGIR